jgi:DNA primase
MAGLIPQDFIDELLARTDIVDVVEGRVPLKRKGREFAACCPFHGEKTPSFYVSPQKQFYHCFGCGAHGTAISFLMEYDRLEFPEAVRALAERAGLELPETAEGPRDDGRKRLREVLEAADQWYREQLRSETRAIDYLKGRGISGETAARFGIGYAPDAWDGVLKAVGDSQAQSDALLATGMLIEKEDTGRRYDRFRDRIMFPIRDSRGRTMAFGGRILDKGDPKYMNSPEHPLFHKGRQLYGLYEARQAARDISSLLMVEGYMDVVALSESGVHNAVATLGTSVTPEHLEVAFRVSPEIVFCFDGDRAGRVAAWRALEQGLPCLRQGRSLRFLFLPEGEDPDSLVRAEGAQAFGRRVGDAVPLSEWLCRELAEGLDLATVEGRARLVDRARPLLGKVKDKVYSDLLREAIARAAGMSGQRLGELLTDAPPGGEVRRPGRPQRAPGRLRLTPVREAIALVLQYPAAGARLTELEALSALDLPGIPILRELIERARERPEASTARLLEPWRARPEHEALARLATVELPGDPEDLAVRLQDIIRRLTGPHAITARMETLTEKARRENLSDGEKEELRTLQKARVELEKAQKSGNLAPGN